MIIYLTYFQEELNTTGRPETRYWHGMIYDSINDEIIIFGGFRFDPKQKNFKETWIFSSNNWILKKGS